MKTTTQKIGTLLFLITFFFSITTLKAQCTLMAGFTSTNPNPNEIVVSNNSSGGGSQTTYWVDFGDGSGFFNLDPSTAVPTNHTYASSGTYIVCVTGVDSLSSPACADTYCDSVYVSGTAAPLCQAQFWSYPDSINPLDVYFYNYSIGSGSATYAWSYGDGTTGTGLNSVHTYTANGTYIACLVMTDIVNGCSDSTCQSVTVSNVPVNPGCNAYFYAYPDSTNPHTLWVVNMSSGNNLTYSWTMGDGGTMNTQYGVYTYGNPGIYNICLTITDPNTPCSDTYCDSTLVTRINPSNIIYQVNVISGTTGIKNNNTVDAHVKLFPNPVTDNANITFNLNENKEVFITVYDVTGKSIQMVNEQAVKGLNTFAVPTENLSNGIYFINILDENNTSIGKIKMIK